MTTAIDTNVLLDIVSGDAAFARAASDAIYGALVAGVVVICPVVYAELSVAFLHDADGLEQFLQQLGVRVDVFSPAALHLAAEAWSVYLGTRGQRAQCPHCGHRFDIACPSCNSRVSWRQRVMPDFMVGGHALSKASALLTRDPRRYTTYFPELTLRSPA